MGGFLYRVDMLILKNKNPVKKFHFFKDTDMTESNQPLKNINYELHIIFNNKLSVIYLYYILHILSNKPINAN